MQAIMSSSSKTIIPTTLMLQLNFIFASVFALSSSTGFHQPQKTATTALSVSLALASTALTYRVATLLPCPDWIEGLGIATGIHFEVSLVVYLVECAFEHWRSGKRAGEGDLEMGVGLDEKKSDEDEATSQEKDLSG